MLLKEQKPETCWSCLLFVVSCARYLDVSCFVYLSVASVSDEQTCLLENRQSVQHISGLVYLGQAGSQALCYLISLEALQLCPWTPRLIAAA